MFAVNISFSASPVSQNNPQTSQARQQSDSRKPVNTALPLVTQPARTTHIFPGRGLRRHAHELKRASSCPGQRVRAHSSQDSIVSTDNDVANQTPEDPTQSAAAKPTETQSSTSKPADTQSTASVFEDVVQSRYSSKRFDSTKPLPEGVLQRCLATASRAPTGFNLQPYVAIVVTDQERKAKLSKAMLGPNIQRVKDAPATVIFAADNASCRLIPKTVKMLKEAGAPPAYLKVLPFYIGIFSGGFGFLSRIPFLRSLFNFIGFIARKIAFLFATYIMAVPAVSSTETWSIKQSMIPASVFMLACTSHGLATCPMEGFDARRLRSAINLPHRYSPAVAFAVGYPAGDEQRGKSPRFPPEDLFFDNQFGVPLTGVPVM
mmetsp:Transcript_20354/g.24413  ORF Transcript_20354/g.24413 Transcript_20354/m.24413 type:complete len:376 (-) Transcript_20354:367-1494(-)|eukprot:CAMPEP_0197860192 /NCGR_PEP_ID=MMETSP1438-20131217/35384_1 /TAXON_ID=1461541 /ORGANISM="Pterosperma sp., Strain CCMP1384" /LENGTH=375 /DNA_ID=CAMNT_0043476969 /DNA_START=420 /DNA_END=1547 /DNA_ORIENTATION=+